MKPLTFLSLERQYPSVWKQCFWFVLSALLCSPWISALHLCLRDIHSPLFLFVSVPWDIRPFDFLCFTHMPVTLASLVPLAFMPQLPYPHSLVLRESHQPPSSPHLYPQEQRGGAGKALGGVQALLSVPAPSWAGNAPSTSRAYVVFVQVQRMKTKDPHVLITSPKPLAHHCPPQHQ